jgi:hypothetical protein
MGGRYAAQRGVPRVANPELFTWWDIDRMPTFLYLTAVLDSTP